MITVTRPEEFAVPVDTKKNKTNKKVNIIISGKFTQSKDEIKKYIINLVHNCKEETELFIPNTKNKDKFLINMNISGCKNTFYSEVLSPHKLMNTILELIYEIPKENIKDKDKIIISVIINLIFYFDSLPELNKINYDSLVNFLTEKNDLI